MNELMNECIEVSKTLKIATLSYAVQPCYLFSALVWDQAFFFCVITRRMAV